MHEERRYCILMRNETWRVVHYKHMSVRAGLMADPRVRECGVRSSSCVLYSRMQADKKNQAQGCRFSSLGQSNAEEWS